VPDDTDRARLAREALARAKADAQARGSRPGRLAGRRAEQSAAGRRFTSDADDSPEGSAAGSTPRPGDAADEVSQGRSDAGDVAAAGSGNRISARPGQTRPGRRERRDDPEPLNAAIGDLLRARGWHEAAAGGALAGRWAELVGCDLAAHTRPDTLADGELTVTADSTAWATQLRLLAAQLVRRLNAELGDGMVRQVRVRGPASAAGPASRPGQWRVRGSRGPRDTYG
jgi:predicted nucleic acid-binding Zn ribbon protein